MFGFHVNKNGLHIHDAINRDVNIAKNAGVKIKCVQIFVSGPMSSVETLNKIEKSAIKEMTKKLKIIIHGSYIDNGWNEKSFDHVQKELKIAEEIGAEGVIIHLSKRTNNNIHLLRNIKTSKILFLEINPAKLSNDTFESAEKLAALFNKIDSLKLDYEVGLCIDTAHLSSIGVNLRKYGECMDYLLSLPKVRTMIHLNDSKAVPGSGIDRHENLYEGYIWRGMRNIESGIDAVFDFADRTNSMIILERADIAGDIETLSAK